MKTTAGIKVFATQMRRIFYLAAICASMSCQKKIPPVVDPGPPFAETPQIFPLAEGNIDEASGIADSKANPGYLWVEEDSGNPPQVRLLGHDGKVGKSIAITGAINRDWEDMTLANGPQAGKNYLYLADIGDNDAKYGTYSIYRFEEPLMSVDEVSVFDKIDFTYPDGSHDAEAFVVDGNSKDIYIITKRDAASKIYRLSYPQNLTSSNTAVFVADLGYTGVVSAAQSADGSALIIKTYTNLYYYPKNSGESLPAVFAKAPESLAYQLEPQGEAVSFASDNSGFYTLSEKGLSPSVSLNFYKRK